MLRPLAIVLPIPLGGIRKEIRLMALVPVGVPGDNLHPKGNGNYRKMTGEVLE